MSNRPAAAPTASYCPPCDCRYAAVPAVPAPDGGPAATVCDTCGTPWRGMRDVDCNPICANCGAPVRTGQERYVAYEYEPDGFTVSGIRHVCWPRDQRAGRLIAARRAASATPKRYDELAPGDRIVLPGGVVRTFSHGGPNGTVNRDDRPLWSIFYREGRTAEWSGGNGGLPSHVCQVLEPTSTEATDSARRV